MTFHIYRSDQGWFRCPTCLVYYVYEGERPTGRLVYSTKKNPFTSQCDDTGKCIDKKPFYKTVTYSDCPTCRCPTLPTYNPTKEKQPMPDVADLEGLQ